MNTLDLDSELFDEYSELDEYQYADTDLEFAEEYDELDTLSGESESEEEARRRLFPRPMRGPERSRPRRPRPLRLRWSSRLRPPRPVNRPQRPIGVRLRPRPEVIIKGPASPCICPAHGTEFIRWVQSSLNQVLDVTLPVDGIMNAATRNALRRFQEQQGLLVDGIAGPETERALIEARARQSGQTPESSEFEDLDLREFDSELELETVGGIPKRDYLRWIQFSLNMYFKKTGLHPPIVENGKDTQNFRNAVELFNAKATGRRKYRKIDETTQDTLIIANEHNSGYLSWLKTQLNKLGYAPLTISYGANEKPTSAIRAFQKTYDEIVGFSLKEDGVVGAKTHLALLRAIRRLKPVDPPKPIQPNAPNLIEMLKKVPIDSLGRSPAERLRLQRVQIFLARALAGERVDDRYWQFTIFDGFGRPRPCNFTGTVDAVKRGRRPQSALANFKRSCATARSVQEVGRCLKIVHDAVLCHINALLGWASANQALGDSALRDFPECAWLLDLQAASVRTAPKSIYSCFAELLRNVHKVCT